MRLTKYEKETVILFNEAENTASIYTYNTELKKRLTTFAGIYPALCRLEKCNGEGGVTYVMEKSRLSIRLIAPYSEKRRQQARKQVMKHNVNSQVS